MSVGENVVERGWTTVRRKPRRGELALICFKCLGSGHFAKDCRELLKCLRCGGFGHRRAACGRQGLGSVAFASSGGALPPLLEGAPLAEVEASWSEEIEVLERTLATTLIVVVVEGRVGLEDLWGSVSLLLGLRRDDFGMASIRVGRFVLLDLRPALLRRLAFSEVCCGEGVVRWRWSVRADRAVAERPPICAR
jgi:hypothetical protein